MSSKEFEFISNRLAIYRQISLPTEVVRIVLLREFFSGDTID